MEKRSTPQRVLMLMWIRSTEKKLKKTAKSNKDPAVKSLFPVCLLHETKTRKHGIIILFYLFSHISFFYYELR